MFTFELFVQVAGNYAILNQFSFKTSSSSEERNGANTIKQQMNAKSKPVYCQNNSFLPIMLREILCSKLLQRTKLLKVNDTHIRSKPNNGW